VKWSHGDKDSRLGPSLNGVVVSVCDQVFNVAVIDEAADAVADAIAEQLFPDEPKKQARAKPDLWANHAVCSVLAAMADALDHLNRLVPELVEDAVRAQLLARGATELRAEIGGKAAKVIADKLQTALTGGVITDRVEALRYAAIAACPDPERHPAVREYCEKPIAKEFLTTEVRAVLEAMVPDRSPPTGPRSPWPPPTGWPPPTVRPGFSAA
jgi:hypothetical protein